MNKHRGKNRIDVQFGGTNNAASCQSLWLNAINNFDLVSGIDTYV